MTNQTSLVELGHVSGLHGLQGWIKVYSLTQPREAIFDYSPWLLGEQHQVVEIAESRRQGKVLVVRLAEVDTREQAEELVNQSIAVYRSQLPELDKSQYYWMDLIGLEVVLADGEAIGKVSRMMATGANDVMVVSGREREHLIPFVLGRYVQSVDLDAKRITADWDKDF